MNNELEKKQISENSIKDIVYNETKQLAQNQFSLGVFYGHKMCLGLILGKLKKIGFDVHEINYKEEFHNASKELLENTLIEITKYLLCGLNISEEEYRKEFVDNESTKK